MFKLGFFTDISEINKIVEYLLHYLGAEQSNRNKGLTKSITSKPQKLRKRVFQSSNQFSSSIF